MSGDKVGLFVIGTSHGTEGLGYSVLYLILWPFSFQWILFYNELAENIKVLGELLGEGREAVLLFLTPLIGHLFLDIPEWNLL